MITIVVVTYNSRRTIEHCIDSVADQRAEGVALELIVVDNGSTDGTLECLAGRSDVALLQPGRNLGFAGGNNLGIRHGRGEYILLLNPDAALGKGFLRSAIAAMAAEPRVALLVGKVLRMTEDGQPCVINGRFVIDTLGLGIKRNRQAIEIGHGDVDTGQHNRGGEVFAVSGAVLFARRLALDDAAVDGQIFDEAFFVHKEDLDLAWRLRLLGWKNVCVPSAVAYHVGFWRDRGRSRSQVPRLVRFHSFKNRRLMLLKNEVGATILRDLLPIVMFEAAAFVYVLVREPFLLSAYASVLRLLPRAWRWRCAIQRRRRSSWRDVRRLIGQDKVFDHASAP